MRDKRTYSVETKQRAVRMVTQLRVESGAKRGTIKRVATQLGMNSDALGMWVQAETGAVS